MRVLILGAGGIGGFFGGHLVRAGVDVSFLVRERRASQLREMGLIVESPLGTFTTPVVPITDGTNTERPDLILLACKAYDLPTAIETVAPAVGTGTIILPLLNGLAHIDLISGRFPHATVWGGLAHLGVTLTEDGTVRHLNNLSILQFGARRGAVDPTADQFALLFAGTPIDASARQLIEQDMWDKFVFLSTLAGMTCMMRATVGTIVSTPAGEHLVTRLLDECIAVADASGHRPSDAQLATYRSQLTQRKSASKASMLRDIERGSRTEGEHILGDMHARAKSLSVDTPLLEVALTHLRAYEASRTSA
jgi:2-dehydropantoate 2-reductase